MRRETTVPFPTPPGPEMTMIRGRPSGGELVEQPLALLGAEAADPAGVRDPDLLHRAAGLHLPDAREGLEDGDDLHLADDVVALGLVEQLPERGGAHLELLLELRAGP